MPISHPHLYAGAKIIADTLIYYASVQLSPDEIIKKKDHRVGT